MPVSGLGGALVRRECASCLWLHTLTLAKEVLHDSPAPADDRRHAGTEFVAADAGLAPATGFPVRSRLPKIARGSRPRGDSHLPGVSGQRKETSRELDRPRPTLLSGGAMSRPKLEVADICRRYGEGYCRKFGAMLSGAQRRVMRTIGTCRTAVLGGHVEQCDGCGHQRVCYNSCRNRACPECRSLARARCLEKRRAGPSTPSTSTWSSPCRKESPPSPT